MRAIVYASSMPYGWGNVYVLTKVLGDEMCRAYHEIMDASIVMLRYHEFVLAPYLAYGPRLLRNGVDRSDVASATVAALQAVIDRRVGLFSTIVHTAHGIPADILANFPERGRSWLDDQLPLPDRVEQRDLSEAAAILGWRPSVGFLEFMRDLRDRDARGEDARKLWVPGELGQATVK